MFRLKGTRRVPSWNVGPASVRETCSECGYYDCQCPIIKSVDNKQNEFQNDLKKLIGKCGDNPEWEGLKDDLVGLFKRLQKRKI